MCGICGIIDWAGKEVDERTVLAMRDMMTVRGPDDAGLHMAAGVGMGHRRLSIIDLSPAGHQPMANEDQTVWIVFNGEIYNFRELRPQLQAAGHKFRSNSDTEVLLHGYEQWGLKGLATRIVGMFAAAIWDGKTRSLHLLRDPLGKKPLFYRYQDGRLLFASDIKSLWAACDGKLQLNEEALDDFLYYSVISQERTIFRGVERLHSGTTASFDGRGVTFERYWSPDYTKKQARTTEEYLEGIDHYLRQAVKRRLIADVPLGGFLSGGVDSSCICALMAQETGGACKTFSVGFENAPGFDERQYSRLVAKHIGSQHTELVAQPHVASILSNLVWQYGEPYGDSSMIPTYLIAQEARKHVTTVLTGDGGDEGFAGYGRHLRADLPDLHGRWPAFIRNGLVPLLSSAYSAMVPSRKSSRNFRLFADYLSGNVRALAMSNCWFDGLRERLYSPALHHALAGYHPQQAQRELLAGLGGPTFVDKALEYLVRTTLVNDYLVKVDVATMAHSLEARCPFLDRDLIDFAVTIPAQTLIEGHQAKALLKQYAQTLVPREAIYRRKQGFAIPIRHWFRDDWGGPLKELLLSPQALGRGYFQPDFLRKIVTDHVSGKTNHVARIWTMLVFEIWNRLFVDRTLKPGDPVLNVLD